MEASQYKTLMTEGAVWKKIVFFALPLFLGNLFQQLYNTADSLIVGNFLGENALAAGKLIRKSDISHGRILQRDSDRRPAL